MKNDLNIFLTEVPEKSFGKGSLSGKKYALKDNILFEGVRSTAGSKILDKYIAPYDATVVTKLKESGAILVGKTNMDEFAMGSSTENSSFGPTKNPWDPTKVPGGSSGGSAAAVAAGYADFALGSDTGGSIRQPAAFCGVVGFKPTYGVVSRYGLMAMSSSLDQIGTFTNSAEDAAQVMDVISGSDELDSTSSETKLEFVKALDKKEKLTLGIPKEYFETGVDEKVKERVTEAIELMKKNGFKTKQISLPHTNFALAVYYLIMPVEVASNLSRFDGIKYGYSSENESSDEEMTVTDVMNKSRALGFGEEAKRRIMLGTFASSSGYYDAYYIKAQKIRTLVIKDFEEAFKEVDFIVSPTTPEVAFGFGEKTDDPVKMYACDALTVPANIAGIPAVSIPCGFSDGLPVGLQFMGPMFSDDRLLSLANQYEKMRGVFNGPSK